MERMFYVPKLYTSILLESMHSAKVQAGWSFPHHRHSFFEFIYCASGSMEQWINGQPYRLNAGDAIVVKSGLYHHTAELRKDAEFFVFHFDVDMKEVQSIFQLVVNPLLPGRDDGSPFNVSGWVNDFLQEFHDLLIQDAEMKPSVRMLRMQMRILEFICQLADVFARENEAKVNEQLSPNQISLAHEIAFQLELRAIERLEIGELARHMGFHRSYLSSCFKSVYGMSPRQYLTKIKIRSAKQLLQHTELTIEEIALKLEFSSAAHFSKFFHNSEGMPPLKYRNRLNL